ncbi:phage tail protein [Lactococcus lactis]|uniref:phage tail protein n=1 Tax=Lactococcus lactis TaxID=1358 RepID=UPI0022E851EE|nr:phage tail protein [Lactococcus lactis]
MQITIHDNQMNQVGFLSNEVPGLPSFFNDNWHRYLAEGASTFDLSVNKFKNGALQDYCQFLNEQAYISFIYEGEDFLFSVLTSEETDDVITLNCATLNLELRNEQANPLVNSASHNIQWYFDNMQLISTSQITIGINEVSNLTRTINYDGQETKLARLLSVIGNFDAEFEFVTELNDDGTLKGMTLNIYKANDGANIQGVGTWRNDVTLYFGKNVSEVRRTVDRTQIFNATNVTGADGLNWNNSEWSVKNADGVEEFYKRKGSTLAFAPLSAELYPSQIQSATGDIWIRKDFETEYTNVNDMWGYALSQFKKYAYALVTYEVSAKSQLVSQAVGDGKPLSIGDTVRIQDENFNAQTGGLILQARVSELEISFSNPSNNKLTFSNYIELESGISDDLEARLAQLIKDNTPYRSEITSTNGIQFKNSTGTTDLTAHIYFGSDTIETIADGYEWSKDGTVVANVQTITIDASGVNDKAVYSFKATIGDKVVGTQSVTITNVNDGEAGEPGTPGTDGRSVTNIEQKYRLTTSSSIPTQDWNDSGWLTSQPTTTSTNKYLWSITRTTFNLAPLTQDVVEQKAVYGDKGEPGDDGTPGTPGTSAINIDLSNKSYNFLANLEVSDSGSVMQAVAGSTTTTFTALQGAAAINITALTCTTTLPTGMIVSIGTLNALSVVVTISVDDTMITPNGILNFSITAGGVTTTKSFSYSLAINDLTVINLAAINSNLGNVKNIYSNYNGSDGGTYSGTIEINDENIKITATNDNDSNEVSKTQMNGENGIWHSTKLQKINSPGVYVLSNWSLTGTTLSFESQQSDLTYPNGYYYASYGIDMHARNIVGDSISQTADISWTNLTLASGFSIGSGGKARYRVENGVLYLHFRKIVCPAMTGNQPNTICYVPANGRASDGYDSFGVMSATNSTRIQYNDSGDGKVAIVPASNTNAGQGFNGILICPMD